MNKGIYRLVFNKRLGMLVPCAEIATSQGKAASGESSISPRPQAAEWPGEREANSETSAAFRIKALVLFLAAAIGSPLALANPTNPTVVSGTASFSQSGSSLTVTNTPNAIINWGSFSIGKNELTKFVQQSSASAVLNRVTGQDPSQILGQLQSNGRVFLINPNGVLFGQGSRIDVAGLIASSLNISNADFLSGKLKFAGTGAEGAVKNAGNITTPSGGQVILIAPNVENSGVITSPKGEIILAAGHTVELTDTLNPAMRVEVTAPDNQAVNLGSLIAEGGQIGMYAGLTTQSGTVNATSVVAEGGRIYLKGTKAVTLTAGSVTEANGAKGGEITVTSAEATTVEHGALIQANARQNGDGGKVLVWSDGTTVFDGSIEAKGGVQSGNGGFAEVSGLQGLGVTGHADLSAPNGKAGEMLLDPGSITISTAASNAATGTLNNAWVNTQLGNSSLTLATTDAGFTTNGATEDITVNAALTWATANTLTLNAGRNIAINQNITASGGGGLALNAGQSIVGSNTIASTINTSGGTVALNGATTLSGTIKNSTLTSTATLAISGTLDGVTLGGGTLNVSGNPTINNGITLADGVTVNKGNGTWYFGNTGLQHIATPGSATLNSTGGRYYAGYGVTGQTLQIDSGITLAGYSYLSNYHAAPIINAGTINANVSGQWFYIDNTNFTNSGTMNATGGGGLNIAPGTFTNNGTLNLDASGGTINIVPNGGTAPNWSNPGNISLNGGILNLGGTFTVADLTGAHYTRTGGTVNLTSTLDNTGNVLDIGSAGLFGMGGLNAVSGTLKNGTVLSTDAGHILNISGTLDGVTLGGGTLNVSGNPTINNGITLADGVTVNKGNGTWYFGNTGLQHIATPGSATLNSTGGRYYAGYGVTGQTLQIDSGITLAGYSYLSNYHAAPIINAGTINANVSGQWFYIDNTNFTNSGTMNATGGGGLNIAPGTFTNNGTLNLDASGGTINIVPNGGTAPNWSNPGNISLNGGILNLGGTFTVADLTGAHYTRTGGTVNLTSTLDNTGNVLDIGSAGLFGTGGLNSLSGTIKNGTLVHTDATHTLTSNSGTLDGVTIGSNLTENGSLWINNGLTLANGVTVDKGSSTWYFNTTGLQHIATPGTATINSAGGVIYAGYWVSGQTLQIDSGITLQGYGALSQYYGNTTINNAGTIIANTAGQTFTISPTTFTNSGSISVAAGTLNISGTTFTNSLSGSVTAGAGTALNITPSTTFTNDGTLTLGGATHTIGTTNTNWTNAGSIALNNGTLNLGGNVNAAQLDPLHYTRVAGTIVNLAGTLDNTGNVLDIGSAGVFGTGGLNSLSGTIKNGTLVHTDATHTLTSNSGTLDGVTIGSNLTANGTLYINNTSRWAMA